MSDAEAIERAMRDALRGEAHADTARLARLLAAVAAGALSEQEAIKQIETEPPLLDIVRLLTGKVVKTSQSVLSFGETSQFGDVTIDSVVGRDQITLNVNIVSPQGAMPTDWRRWLAFGALALVGLLALWRYGPSSVVIPPAARPAAAPTLAAPTSQAQATGISTPTPSFAVRPTSVAQASVEQCIASVQPDVAVARIFLIEAGADASILGLDDPRDQPIVLALTKSDQPLATVVLDMDRQNQSYVARAVLAAGCQHLPDNRFNNHVTSRQHLLQAWDSLLLCLDTGSYRIRAGAPLQPSIQVITRLAVAGDGCPP